MRCTTLRWLRVPHCNKQTNKHSSAETHQQVVCYSISIVCRWQWLHTYVYTHTRCLKIMLHRDNNRSLYNSSNIVFLSHARALPSYKNNCHKMQFCHLKTFYFKMNISVEGKTAYNNVLLLKSKRLAWCLFKGWIYAQKWLTYKLSIKIQLQGLQSNISLNKLYTTVTIYLQFWSPCQKVTEG